MKRRGFLQSLAAVAAVPVMPFKALASAPAAAAASLEQPYLWASFVARVHNKASPQMLMRLLKLEPEVAHSVYQKLVADSVISAPNAMGMSRAINPYPQVALSGGPPQATLQIEAPKDKINNLARVEDEIEAANVADSSPVNQDLTDLQDERESVDLQDPPHGPDGPASA